MGYYNEDSVKWRENTPFHAVLSIQGTQRGRSAARFTWTDNDGHRYPMFMTDMVDTAKSGSIIRGVCVAWWTVQKRGQNYGIRVATQEELAAQPHSGIPGECAACAALPFDPDDESPPRCPAYRR